MPWFLFCTHLKPLPEAGSPDNPLIEPPAPFSVSLLFSLSLSLISIALEKNGDVIAKS